MRQPEKEVRLKNNSVQCCNSTGRHPADGCRIYDDKFLRVRLVRKHNPVFLPDNPAAVSYTHLDVYKRQGEWLPITLFGERHPGAWGKMRVSRSKLDEKLSTDYNPVQAHTCYEKLEPVQIVPVDIEIVPTSWFWHKGQQIRVQVSGRYIRDEWFEPLTWDTDNKGNHLIYTGGQYESFLQIPVIPPKFQDGDIIIR